MPLERVENEFEFLSETFNFVNILSSTVPIYKIYLSILSFILSLWLKQYITHVITLTSNVFIVLSHKQFAISVNLLISVITLLQAFTKYLPKGKEINQN